MTGVVSIAKRNEAKVMTTRIARLVEDLGRTVERLQQAIQDAREANVHATLGFPSWTAYITDTMRSAAANLSDQDRRKLIATLANVEGMSVRAIAPIVAVSKSTVARELEVSRAGTPVPTAAPITGLDGKSYVVQAKQSKAPQRRPITKDARDVGWEVRNKADAFRKAVARLEPIREDDRFDRNRTELDGYLRGALMAALDDIEVMLTKLGDEQ